MNKVIAIGRLTRDPELRYTQDQMAICTFTLAIPKIGKEGADFPRVTIFGKTAENCERYLKKGSQVAVDGNITTGSYEKDGKTVYTCGITAQRVEFLATKTETGEPTVHEESPADSFESIDEDVPF